MQLTIKAALFHSIKNIETFYIKVVESRKSIIIKRLELERIKMIDCLKELKSEGKIHIISNPIDVTLLKEVKRGERITSLKQKRKTSLQEDIDRLVLVKRELKKSIKSIKDFYN